MEHQRVVTHLETRGPNSAKMTSELNIMNNKFVLFAYCFFAYYYICLVIGEIIFLAAEIYKDVAILLV